MVDGSSIGLSTVFNDLLLELERKMLVRYTAVLAVSPARLEAECLEVLLPARLCLNFSTRDLAFSNQSLLSGRPAD